MGYETTFRLKGELDSQFKTWMKDIKKEDIEKHKTVLLATCMSTKIEDNDSWHLVKEYDRIMMAFKMYLKYLVEDWKNDTEKRLNEETEYCHKNEIYFCGWNHAKNDCAWESEEEITGYFVKNLFMLAIEPCASPFDNEDRTYYRKTEKLEDYINDLPVTVYDMMDSKFISFYRDNPDLADESDGYEHSFPEEKENNEEEKDNE